MSNPCVIFDSHHPKHYLTIRRLGDRCRRNGIDVIWTARKKDVLVQLMREDGLTPIVLTAAQDGLLRKLGELAIYDWKLARLARRHRPLALLGKAISLAHVGRLLGIPSILINDDSAQANPQYRYLGYPFATRVLTADCLTESYGPRQHTYPGLMELAYLHPDAFTADPGIRRELGLESSQRIFLVRLVAFKAYHDAAETGISRELLGRLVTKLSMAGTVYISSEGPLYGDFANYRFPLAANRLHHVIAASDLVLGDGVTVCVEAALLGRPAIFFGSYARKLAYFRALRDRFGLVLDFLPGDENEFLGKIDELLTQSDALQQWSERRNKMLSVWTDPTEVYWKELMEYVAVGA
jgi:hypothetical protein